MKINKKIFYIFFLILLSQCGYTTVYNNNTDSKIKIILLDSKGNKEINNKISSGLKKYYNIETENVFKINMNTILSKEIISKDTTGKITNYELRATSNFIINYKGKNLNASFQEKINVKNIDDTFEQRKYENVVKNNFASSIQEKLVLKLKTLK